MNELKYEATHSTPGIQLNHDTGILEMYGRSIPENALTVYKPVMDWLENYTIKPREKTILNFKIEFFNTSSSKFILQILKKLEEIHKQGYSVEVNWYYNDNDILDLAEDYAELVDVPFLFHEAALRIE